MEERFIFDAEKLSRAWTNGNEIKRETNIVESRSFRLNFKNFSFDVHDGYNDDQGRTKFLDRRT